MTKVFPSIERVTGASEAAAEDFYNLQRPSKNNTCRVVAYAISNLRFDRITLKVEGNVLSHIYGIKKVTICRRFMVGEGVFYHYSFTNHTSLHDKWSLFLCRFKGLKLESHAMSHAVSSAFVFESVTLTNKVECTSPSMDFHYIIVEKWSEF